MVAVTTGTVLRVKGYLGTDRPFPSITLLHALLLLQETTEDKLGAILCIERWNLSLIFHSSRGLLF